MAGKADYVVVVGPDSPLVDVIVDEKLVRIGRPTEPLDAAQRLRLNRELVAQILNLCFWASLSQEEGREVASGLTFVSPSKDTRGQFSLQRPEPLTQESLVRLGTVAGISHRLAVHELDGKPVVWGFLRGRGTPDLVTIWFDRPGTLRVMGEGPLLLGMLNRGALHRPCGFVFANPMNVLVQIQRIVGAKLVDALVALRHVASEMGRHGHGGTLLVVSEDRTQWERELKIRYPFDEGSRTLLTRADARAKTPGADGGPSADDLPFRTIQQVAAFTKIDGVVVVGEGLTVFGFGARITSADCSADRPVVKKRTIFQEEFADVDWTSLGGMRHQSAALFVAATKTAAAFVASHDGALSLLAWGSEPTPGHLVWLCGLESLIPPR